MLHKSSLFFGSICYSHLGLFHNRLFSLVSFDFTYFLPAYKNGQALLMRAGAKLTVLRQQYFDGVEIEKCRSAN